MGVITDPAVVSADDVCSELVNVVAELAEATPHVLPGRTQSSAGNGPAQ